jgi:low affinity Fe/Cu permease
MAVTEPPAERSRPAGSRLLYRADLWASRPATALVLLAGVLAWVLVSLAAGFPGRWETVFQTLVAALTLTMVFVIQHTQARQQAATQRRLDEILEHATDRELRASGDLHRGIRQAALDEQSGQDSPAH